MQLAHPFWLLLLILLPLPWIFLRRKGYVGYSDLRLVQGISRNPLLHKLPLVLLSIAYVFLLIGLARPQIPHSQTTRTSQRIACSFVLAAVSRSWFRRSFGPQYSSRVFGNRARRQP